jgi:peptidoglycan/LPS O-acetylase OafA/YrhL
MRLAFIDSLRAVAAMSVILFHLMSGNHIPMLYESFPIWLREFTDHSNAGVAVFFVLSGFVISLSLEKTEPTFANFGRFILRRSIRLDPAYWVTIFLSCIALALKHETFSTPQIISHLFYAQELLGTGALNPIFWTLCLEVQFYLVFALLLLTRSTTVLVLAFVVSLPLSVIDMPHGLFTSLWYGFLLGVGVQMTLRSPHWMPSLGAYMAVLLGIAFMHYDVFMMVCVLTSVLILVVGNANKLGTALNFGWLQFVGAISYSLYLIHNLAIGAVFRAFPANSQIKEAVLCCIAVTVAIISAYVLWLFVEKPSLSLSRSLMRRDRYRERVV